MATVVEVLPTVFSDLESDSFSQTGACARLLTECIKKAMHSEPGDAGHYFPNPQVHGKNQKRKQRVCGPTTANRQASEVKPTKETSKCGYTELAI